MEVDTRVVARLETGSQTRLAAHILLIAAAARGLHLPSQAGLRLHAIIAPLLINLGIYCSLTTIIRTQLNMLSRAMQGYLTRPNQLATLMHHLELACTKRKLLYKKYARTAVLPSPFLLPLCHSDGDSQHILCRSILHLNVTTTPITASITETGVCSYTPTPALKKPYAYAAH